MKEFIATVALILLSLSFGLQAQNENEERWENYVNLTNDGVEGFTVRLDLLEYAPIAGFPNLLKVTNYYSDKRADGFPTSKVFDELSEVTLDLLLSLNGQVSFVYAGSTTSDGSSTEYIYLEETEDIEKRVRDFYAKNHPDIKYDIDLSQDLIWKFYKEELYPDERTLNYLNDKKVIQNLIDNGDDIMVPRRVDHWIFFKTETDLNNFGDKIKEFKFYVESIEDFNNKEWPIQLVISREDAVDLKNISEITGSLRRIASEHNGIYDGWGTNVIQK